MDRDLQPVLANLLYAIQKFDCLILVAVRAPQDAAVVQEGCEPRTDFLTLIEAHLASSALEFLDELPAFDSSGSLDLEYNVPVPEFLHGHV